MKLPEPYTHVQNIVSTTWKLNPRKGKSRQHIFDPKAKGGGNIRPSTSEHAYPIKPGTNEERIVIDYRKLNKAVKMSSQVLP
jgi:hypothetical protein